MEVDKTEIKILERALDEWTQKGLLTNDKATELKETIVPRQTDRQQVAQYFFFIALFCILLAFGAIFINEKILEKIKAYFSWSNLVISLITAALSAIWFWYIGKKRNKLNPAAYETYMVLGGLSILTSLLYICKEINADTSYTAFLALSFIALIPLSTLLRSQALWIGAILAAICWFGIFSIVQSKDNLFLSMNYPLRYTVLGGIILIAALLQGHIKALAFTKGVTYVTGLILLFTGLWAVSIFGNYNTLAEWEKIRQIHVLAYSIVFGLAAVASFYLGIRYKDSIARDFGMLFLLINLYTRYFEFFWDAMNKGIFFLILAITFGFVGWWLDKKKGFRIKANPVTD